MVACRAVMWVEWMAAQTDVSSVGAKAGELVEMMVADLVDWWVV